MKINKLIVALSFFVVCHVKSAEVNSWECGKFEDASIVGGDGTYLGKLGPKWLTDSIFNTSSIHSSTWSSESIFNDNNEFGNSYSNTSVFNNLASDPPKIISESGFVGYLSTGPEWHSDRFSPYDIKYTCDWD
mgnify:CR=1 FL=1|tara:strand:- start:1179 stop:1577 length:399 start_codon:yes stop_codon:yes gene_type:complete